MRPIGQIAVRLPLIFFLLLLELVFFVGIWSSLQSKIDTKQAANVALHRWIDDRSQANWDAYMKAEKVDVHTPGWKQPSSRKAAVMMFGLFLANGWLLLKYARHTLYSADQEQDLRLAESSPS